MTYWMCEKCSFVIEAPKPPDPCPSCKLKCVFSDVTCYTPECGGIGSLDSRLVAQRVIKKEKPGKGIHFSDIVKGQTSEGKEKHIPFISVMNHQGQNGKDIVEILVGKEVPHPSTADHYIMWIQALGMNKDGRLVDLGRQIFKPIKDKPLYALELDSSEFKYIYALSYCNLHGIWEHYLEL